MTNRSNITSIFSLFLSFGTLICCALPAALVVLGLGASLAGLVTSFPQLVWISEHKLVVFLVAGGSIALSFYLQRANAVQSCPSDALRRNACEQSRQWSRCVLWVALVVYAIGFFFAYLLPILL